MTSYRFAYFAGECGGNVRVFIRFTDGGSGPVCVHLSPADQPDFVSKARAPYDTSGVGVVGRVLHPSVRHFQTG